MDEPPVELVNSGTDELPDGKPVPKFDPVTPVTEVKAVPECVGVEEFSVTVMV